MGTLYLTPWGKFCNEYSVTVPVALWEAILELAEKEMEADGDWKFVLGEIAAGCTELGENERLCEILAAEGEG